LLGAKRREEREIHREAGRRGGEREEREEFTGRQKGG
jgi:hypothetical protein